MSVGDSHTCIVRQSGKVSCWGSNFSGELGDGTLNTSNVPVDAMGITTAIGVSAGGSQTVDFSCAVIQGGGVMCWGYGHDGEMGNGASFKSVVPVTVETAIPSDAGDAGLMNVADVTTVSCGDTFACAVRVNGSLWCWGNDFDGELGNNSTTSTNVAVPGSTLTTVSNLSAGAGVGCAVQSSQLYCWGSNVVGQIGDGTTNNSLVPVTVVNL